MKKNILILALFIIQINFAQNTFPANGNVGIGTLSPTSKLDVLGTIKSFETTTLGAPLNSSQLINEISGSCGANRLYNRSWLLRDNISSADWSTTRLHDGVSIDVSFATPQTNTRTWWERDPQDNIQSWGDGPNTYLTINKGNVGIGDLTPGGKLVLKDNNQSLAFFTNQKLVGTWPPVSEMLTMTIQSSGDSSGNIAFATGNDEAMRIQRGGNVGIGTTNPLNKLDVKGTIHSQEVKVDMLGWSDFVFKKEYTLPTLEEVEKHITEKGHLENIPSEEEVLKNGISLGEMNAKLLQKIEELTLYMIQQNFKLKNQENEIIELKKDNTELTEIKQRLIKLEKRL